MPDFTADELHRHIQLTVFGRTRQSHERYNELQDKLHELVDRPSDVEIIRNFLQKVMGVVGPPVPPDPDWYKRHYVELMLVFNDIGGYDDDEQTTT